MLDVGMLTREGFVFRLIGFVASISSTTLTELKDFFPTIFFLSFLEGGMSRELGVIGLSSLVAISGFGRL